MNGILLTATVPVDPSVEEIESSTFTDRMDRLEEEWTLYWEDNGDAITENGARFALNIADTVTDSSMGFVTEVVFSEYSGVTGAFSMLHTIAGSAALLVMIIMITVKGIQGMLNNASGGEYVPPMQLVIDTIKSCILAVCLPWIMVIVLELLPQIGKLLYLDGVIARFFTTSVWDKFINGSAVDYIEGAETVSMYFNPTWWMFSLFMEFCLWLGNVFFMAKMCKFQVEVMLLDATALIAAVDSSTNKREFYENWISSFKALGITFLANVAFYSLMQRCYYSLMHSGTAVICIDSILAIGAALCLIRGTIFTNKYKSGGFMGSGVSGMTNMARSAMFMIPRG